MSINMDSDEEIEYLPSADEDQIPLIATSGVSTASRISTYEDGRGKIRCIKNIILHCVSIVFIFTSYASLQNLENGLNHNLGVESMACLFGAFILSCWFAPFVVKYTGYKWAMVISFVAQCIFAASNMYAKVYTLLPACILLGLSAGPFWTAQGPFLTTLAVQFADFTETSHPVAISRFTGLFVMFLQSSQIWGNLLSSVVLEPPKDINITYLINETCGANFCNNSANNILGDYKPTDIQVLTLSGIYLGFCVAGLLTTVIFVDNIKPDSDRHASTVSVKEKLAATVRMHCNACMLLLIPLFLFNGVEQVLLFSDFTVAFIGCELGVGYIGYAMITFGATNTICSFIAGQLEKCTGRTLLFLFAGGLDLGLILVMIKWTPKTGSQDDWLLYFIPGLWGVADSIWQTTTLSLVAVEFYHDRDSAFATFRLWQAIGMGAAFGYSAYVCMIYKLYLVIGLLAFSLVLYLLMETVVKRKMNKPYIDLYAPIIE